MRLRKLEEKDIPFILEWMHDENVNRYFRFNAENADEKSVAAFIKEAQNSYVNLHMACANDNDEYLGTISLKNIDKIAKNAEFAISFRACAHGTGAAAFAAHQILNIAFFQLGLNTVYLDVIAENTRAVNFYKKMGFNLINESTAIFERDGNEHKMLEFSISADVLRPVLNAARMMEFAERGDERGHLVVAEGGKEIPFEIKRVFYIYGSDKNVIRGCHANRISQFMLINVSGKSKVKVMDGRGGERVFELSKPHTGIYIPNMLWKEMYDFSDDSVLLVLASTQYNSEEYIRCYEDYVKEASANA